MFLLQDLRYYLVTYELVTNAKKTSHVVDLVQFVQMPELQLPPGPPAGRGLDGVELLDLQGDAGAGGEAEDGDQPLLLILQARNMNDNGPKKRRF